MNCPDCNPFPETSDHSQVTRYELADALEALLHLATDWVNGVLKELGTTWEDEEEYPVEMQVAKQLLEMYENERKEL